MNGILNSEVLLEHWGARLMFDGDTILVDPLTFPENLFDSIMNTMAYMMSQGITPKKVLIQQINLLNELQNDMRLHVGVDIKRKEPGYVGQLLGMDIIWQKP